MRIVCNNDEEFVEKDKLWEFIEIILFKGEI